MSKEPERLKCDWCKNTLEKEEPRCEVKIFNEGQDNHGDVLDCCVKCFQNLKPKNIVEKKGFSLGF